MKILGGKSNTCPYCKGTMIYLELEKTRVVSQCRNCGCMTDGRTKDEVQIYTYEVENEG